MKPIKFLTEAFGEYNDTPRSLIEPYIGQHFDRTAEKLTIRNSDDCRYTSKLRYKVEEVQIPNFLEPSEYIAEELNWEYFVKCGGTEKYSKNQYYLLMNLEPCLRLACIKLYNSTPRKDFRKSLKEQLLGWFKEPKFQNPFSDKQTKYLVNDYIKIEAKQKGII